MKKTVAPSPAASAAGLGAALLRVGIAYALLSGASARAATLESCGYLFGKGNPEIARFGGLAPRTPIQEMANLMLDHIPRATDSARIQIGIPVTLEFNPNQAQQFGDGQRNAFATYGALPNSPFVAVLARGHAPSDPSELALQVRKDLPGAGLVTALEISVLGQRRQLPVDAAGLVRLPVDLAQLGWNDLYGAQPVFFRPVGWTEWFAVQFPDAYVSIEGLVEGMRERDRTLPGGQSVVDPLGLRGSANPQNALRTDHGEDLGFILSHARRADRVHGFYIHPQDGSTTLTATGGLWSRYREDAERFKIVYLAKDPRVLDLEEDEGVVSGTGPHFIGANGEIILNSLGAEPFMTFYGVPAPTAGPDGAGLAWGLRHQWVGTWLQPGQAFVTPQGMYHWHLNHLDHPIAAQVFTPPVVPAAGNHFGFSRP